MSFGGPFDNYPPGWCPHCAGPYWWPVTPTMPTCAHCGQKIGGSHWTVEVTHDPNVGKSYHSHCYRAAQADRSPEGQDRETGFDRNDESPVGEADAPIRSTHAQD